MNPFIYAASGLAVIFVLIWMIIHVSSKTRRNKTLKRLQANLDELKNNQIQLKLKKVEKIAEKNKDYEKIFEDLNQRYLSLSVEKIAELESQIEQIKFLIQDKKNKQVNEDLATLAVKIDSLYGEYDSLDTDVDFINKEEENLRDYLVPIKEEYRIFKEDFFRKKEELYCCKDNFEEYITQLDKDMILIEEKMSNALYDDVREIGDRMLIEIDGYQRHLVKLPKLISFSMQVLPNRLSETLSKYDELKEQGYPLHNIKINTVEKEIRQTLDEIQVSFNTLDYAEIDTQIKNIAREIQEIDELLESEIKARVLYSDNIDNIYHLYSQVGKKFLKAKRDTQKVEGVFKLNENRKEELIVLQNKVHSLDRIKSDLDSYVHSITKQPYSFLSDKMMELKDYGDELELDLNNYLVYIESLRDDSQNAFMNINNYSVEINKRYDAILYTGHEVTIEKFKEPKVKTFELIKDLEKELLSKPINVETVNEKINNVIIESENLIALLIQRKKLYDMAQSVIVFANKYRSSFTDVDAILTKAEIHFDNGEFEYAIDRVSDVLRDVHPTAYQEMMKNKGLKDD